MSLAKFNIYVVDIAQQINALQPEQPPRTVSDVYEHFRRELSEND